MAFLHCSVPGPTSPWNPGKPTTDATTMGQAGGERVTPEEGDSLAPKMGIMG